MEPPRKILIVEDSETIGQLLARRLSGAGYEIVNILAAGEEAIAETARSQPDLILMDITLEGELTGIETAQRIQQIFDIPIIYLTGQADKELFEQAKDTSPFGYILKPFTAAELHATVEIAFYKHQTEQELKTRARQQAAVAHIGQRALARPPLELLLQEATILVTTTLGIEFCQILEYLPDREELLMTAGIGWRKGTVGQTVIGAGAQSQAGYALQANKPIVTPNIAEEDRFAAPAVWSEHGVVSGVSVVIHCTQGPYGTLSAHDRKARAFTNDSVNFLKSVANIIGQAVERSRTEAELERSRRFITQIINTMPAILYIYDLNQDHNVFSNEKVADILGYTVEEIQAMGSDLIPALLHPDDVEQPRETLRQIHASPIDAVAESEYRMKHAGGQWRWLHEWTTVFACDPEGAPERLLGVCLDVTEQKALAEQMEAIYQLHQELTLLYDKEKIIQTVLDTAARVCNFELIALALLDSQNQTLHYRYLRINGQKRDVDVQLPLQGTRGIAPLTARQGRAIYVPDTDEEPRYVPPPFVDWHGRSEYCLPLRTQKQVIGVLNAENSTVDSFTPGDRKLLRALADQASIALENAQFYAQLESAAQTLTALHRAGRALNSSLDLDEVLQKTMEEVQSLLQVEGASLFLFDDTANELYFAAAASQADAALLGRRVPVETSLAGWVLRHKRPILTNDCQNDPRFYNQIDNVTGMVTRSLLAAPLIHKERPIGVVELINKLDGDFQRQELDMVEILASSAAAAIENARLYQVEREQRRKLQTSQNQLIQAEKMAALGRLLSSLTHEINNPIQSVQGCLTLTIEELQEEGRPEQVERYLNIVESEVERIAVILQQTRDFYRPARQEREAVDIPELIAGTLALCAKQIRESGVEVETDWAEDLPPVMANAAHIKQVFLNLFLNALEAMPDGGRLLICVDCDFIEKEDGQQPAVRIQFSDSGEGMSEETMGNLFEPFFTTKEEGTGLGLSVSYGIIRAHQGTIKVTSQEGEGTTFAIHLPIT